MAFKFMFQRGVLYTRQGAVLWARRAFTSRALATLLAPAQCRVSPLTRSITPGGNPEAAPSRDGGFSSTGPVANAPASRPRFVSPLLNSSSSSGPSAPLPSFQQPPRPLQSAPSPQAQRLAQGWGPPSSRPAAPPAPSRPPPTSGPSSGPGVSSERLQLYLLPPSSRSVALVPLVGSFEVCSRCMGMAKVLPPHTYISPEWWHAQIPIFSILLLITWLLLLYWQWSLPSREHPHDLRFCTGLLPCPQASEHHPVARTHGALTQCFSRVVAPIENN